MKTTKKEIIHCAFRASNAIGKKLYMSESDYKKFHKSCEIKFFDTDVVNGADYTLSLVVTDYRKAMELGACFIDHNPVYGGYRLDHFHNEQGAVDHVFTSTRYNASAFVDILRAFISGVYYEPKK